MALKNRLEFEVLSIDMCERQDSGRSEMDKDLEDVVGLRRAKICVSTFRTPVKVISRGKTRQGTGHRERERKENYAK